MESPPQNVICGFKERESGKEAVPRRVPTFHLFTFILLVVTLSDNVKLS